MRKHALDLASCLALVAVASCRTPTVNANRRAVVDSTRESLPRADASVDSAAVIEALPTLPAQGPLLYGVASAVPRRAPGVDSLVAGNLRVEIAHNGPAVRVASEAPSSRLRWAWPLDAGRWAFTTTDRQALVSDTFLGPFTTRARFLRPLVRHATGVVPAVRTDDGLWHRVEGQTSTVIASLEDTAFDLHFVDARRAYAIRTPGELLTSTDGGQRWQPVALQQDLAVRFEHDETSALYLRAGRALYRVEASGLVATDANTVEDVAVDPAVMQRARARWRDHWRANLWPTGAGEFSIESDGLVVSTVEVGGALFWARSGRVHRLSRDGATSSAAVDGASLCELHPFGPNILAHCDSLDDEAPSMLVELDGTTLTARTITDQLNSRTEVTASRDGNTIVFTRFPGPATGPGTALWTRANPTVRIVLGPEPEARFAVAGSTLLSIDRAWIRLASLNDARPRFVDVAYREAGEDRFAPTQLRAAHVREDGHYAVVRVSRGVEGCTVIRGSGPTPSSMRRFTGCTDPTQIAFANDRFGVVVERTKIWVTRDGGERWTAVTRALGAVREGARALIERLPAPVVVDGAIVVAPHQRIAERQGEPEPAWAYRAAQDASIAPAGDDDRDDDDARDRQGCFTDDRAQTGAAARSDATSRSITLLHQRTRVTVTVRRDAARIEWMGDDTGAGRYEGPLPWRRPELDFESGRDVGYAIRGASAHGVLLERCVLEDGSQPTHTPTACDVRWLRRSGAPINIDLQNPPPGGAGAWVASAHADGAGWIVELSSARRALHYAWRQWQLLRPNGTIARWGDFVHDAAVAPNAQLARVHGAWGTIANGVFAPYEGGANEELEFSGVLSFCPRAPRASDDLWLVTDGSVRTAPAMGDGARDAALLRAIDGAWCVQRLFERPRIFRWTTQQSQDEARAWGVIAGRRLAGSGVFRAVTAAGTIETRRITCDAPRGEEEQW